MFLLNQKGQSLIQMIIAGGVGAILLMATLSTQVNQSRENRALTEKLGSLDLQRLLTATVGDSNICGFLIGQLAAISPGKIVFDASAISATTSPPPIDLGNNLPASASPSAPSIATVGGPASPIAQSLIVKAIELSNIKCPSPCEDAVKSDEFTADLQVSYDSPQLVRPIQPAKSQVVLHTTNAGGQKTISGCTPASTVGNTSGDFVIWY